MAGGLIKGGCNLSLELTRYCLIASVIAGSTTRTHQTRLAKMMGTSSEDACRRVQVSSRMSRSMICWEDIRLLMYVVWSRTISLIVAWLVCVYSDIGRI